MIRSTRSMQRNAIILTQGLCGSSVLAGLLGQAGYWMGDSTARKPDYDTYENQELVDLNRRLLSEVGHIEDSMVVRRADVQRIYAASQHVDPAPYRSFVERCNARRPWVWKDPRLWLTMRFWASLLNLADVRFVYLGRELDQLWVSTTLRRQIQSREYSDKYAREIQAVIAAFAQETGQPLLEVLYEDLLVSPETTLLRLNQYLGARMRIDHLKRVYHGPLYRKQRGWKDFVEANLIYFKNYSQRYHSGRMPTRSPG